MSNLFDKFNNGGIFSIVLTNLVGVVYYFVNFRKGNGIMVNTKGQYEVSVDGKSYILSSQDYNIFTDCTAKINEILSRASIVESGKLSSPLHHVGNVPPVREQLTDETGRRILGNLFDNVVYYNHDTGKWNRSEYNGYDIPEQGMDTAASINFKQKLEKMPAFALCELVANVTVVVKGRDYPGYCKWTKEARYDPKGVAVLGNLIVRDKVGGQLRLWKPAWFGVCYTGHSDSAAMGVGCVFARDGAIYADFRAALCAGRVR